MFCSQDVIQGKQAIASALESAEPALAFDKRDLAFVVENVLDFVGDEQWVVTIIGALKALHTAGVESLTLRHSVSKIRSELDHRQHSMHTITEVLGRWFRGKSLVQVAELLVSTIERFCPDMECKDLLTNPAPPKAQRSAAHAHASPPRTSPSRAAAAAPWRGAASIWPPSRPHLAPSGPPLAPIWPPCGEAEQRSEAHDLDTEI